MNRTLIAFGSWEERFRAGVELDLRSTGCQSLVVFYYDGYAKRTEAGRQAVRRCCETAAVDLFESRLGADSFRMSWKEIFMQIDQRVKGGDEVTVDISTMPRDIVWSVFWMLERKHVDIKYVYHSPAEYGGDWLSRDPRPPRMVYKLSGELVSLDETVLLLILGYDFQRAQRLIRWYDPDRIIVGVQTGDRFERNRDLMQQQLEELNHHNDVVSFEVDAFAGDRGRAAIREAIRDVSETENVIMSSLGPKLTSVSIYEVQREFPRFGLAYTPANEFSDDYSSGIGRSYAGVTGAVSR